MNNTVRDYQADCDLAEELLQLNPDTPDWLLEHLISER